MWPKRKATADRLQDAILTYSEQMRDLPGVNSDAARSTLAMQMVASLRRLEFTRLLISRPIDPQRTDPNSELFDPERAAIYHARMGNTDEAFWLVFLMTHFGKHQRYRWKRLTDIYSGLGEFTWTWTQVSANLSAFREWLRQNHSRVGGAFGNHRKYETLRHESANSTASVVESYLNWVTSYESHAKLVACLVRQAGNNPHQIFDHFYRSMQVNRFGRLAKFDFLALIGRLDLAPITPGTAYLRGATGPLSGARLLFCGHVAASTDESLLESWLIEFDRYLCVGMQVLEDSLCNWQKSPRKFINFKG